MLWYGLIGNEFYVLWNLERDSGIFGYGGTGLKESISKVRELNVIPVICAKEKTDIETVNQLKLTKIFYWVIND